MRNEKLFYSKNLMRKGDVKKWVRAAEGKIGLKIDRISDQCGLNQAGRIGLFSLYADIFAEKPYYERFFSAEVKEYFEDLIEKDGVVYTATDRQVQNGNRMVAFVASQPLNEKTGVVQIVSPYVSISESSYFAEDAVIPKRRRQGISSVMKKLLMRDDVLSGYKKMVLRTSVDSFQQAAAVQKFGAQKIKDLYQDVDSLRLDGKFHSDRRMFFVFDLLTAVSI